LRGLDFNVRDVDELIKKADTDKSGDIDYNEWLTAAADASKLL
jgi:hypothetical protein